MNTALNVTAKQIANLSKDQLPALLKVLLHCEAATYGIWTSSAEVPLEISVPDGGEDGRIKWEAGPDRTNFIPRRFALFECKATKMDARKCRSQMLQGKPAKLKPRILEVCDAGGAYIILASRDTVRDKTARVAKMKAAVKDGGCQQPDLVHLDFWDSGKIADWTNEYPQAVLYVHSCTGRSIPLGVRTWEHFRNTPHVCAKYHRNGILDGYIGMLRKAAGKLQSVVRVMGLSGLGKTRLIEEAFRPPGDDDMQQAMLTSSMIYYDAEPNHHREISEFTYELAEGAFRATLVVDNCEPQLHDQLKESVRRMSSKLSLITIDSDVRPDEGTRDLIIMRPADLKNVVAAMITDSFPLAKADIDRIANLAEGFPQIAVLLAERRMDGCDDLGRLGDHELIRRILWGGDPEDKTELKALRACAIFDYFGYEGRGDWQRAFIAESICGIDNATFYGVCQKFAKRGIFERKGDFIRMTPKRLAVYLAAEFWDTCPPENVQGLLEGIESHGLTDSFCDQVAKLHFLPSAQKLAESLCGQCGPFGSAEGLLTAQGSRFLRALSEVNPAAATAALERAIGAWSNEALLAIEGPIRRNLVWSLERLCFWRETFGTAAKVLLSLAAAENETVGNNATGQFLQLFHIQLSGTQATPDERIAVADHALSSRVMKQRILGVKALGSALVSHGFMRMLGAEAQGSRVPAQEWKPKYAKELRDYWMACVSRLCSVIAGDAELREAATHEAADGVITLVNHEMLDAVDALLKSVLEASGPYWPEVVNKLNLLRRHDGVLSDALRDKLDNWLTLLTPTDVKGRLRALVSSAPHDNHKDADGRWIDVSAEKVVALAKELAGDEASIVDNVDVLLRGEQRYAALFGFHIYKGISDPVWFINTVLDRLIEAGAEGSPDLVAGFLRAAPDRSTVTDVLARMASDARLRRHVVAVTRNSRPTAADLARITALLRDGGIDARDCVSFAYSGALDHLQSADVRTFSSDLAGTSIVGRMCALEILYLYGVNDKARWSAVSDDIAALLRTPGLLAHGEYPSNSTIWQWNECALSLLRESARYPGLPAALTSEIIAVCERPDGYALADIELKPLMSLLLERHFEGVWRLIGNALLGDNSLVRLNLQSLLGTGFDEPKNESILFGHRDEQLLEWCLSNRPLAPEVIAGMMPLIASDGKDDAWNSFALRMLDEFGDDEDVLAAISRNMGTMMWRGSLVPHLEKRKALMQQILTHSRPAVQRWARTTIDSTDALIHSEQKRDDEHEWGIY